jgi:hypothetical protein
MGSSVATAIEIRPFHSDIPEEEIGDLRRRIAAPRWPDRETVTCSSLTPSQPLPRVGNLTPDPL